MNYIVITNQRRKLFEEAVFYFTAGNLGVHSFTTGLNNVLRMSVTSLTISFPEAAILLVSDGDRELWILSPQIADFRLHCAESKVKPKMAETSGPDTFLEGVKYGLEKVGKANITLKQKQEEILKIIALTQKDVLAVLPTGYGKSLIYQIMPPLMDYMIICILTKDQPKRSLLSLWCHRSMP